MSSVLRDKATGVEKSLLHMDSITRAANASTITKHLPGTMNRGTRIEYTAEAL